MEDLPNIATAHYHELRDQIKSGDILLCSGNALFSTLIQQATGSAWSHVAFILRLDVIDRVMVLESVESIGVRAVPLSSYIRNYNGSGQGYPGKIMLARHEDVREENIIKLSKTATSLLGYPYDTEEIVRIAARIGMDDIGLKPSGRDPEPRREFICSEYAYTCYKSIGINIAYDPLGFIAPVDFARCAKIQPLYFIQTENRVTRTPRVSARELEAMA